MIPKTRAKQPQRVLKMCVAVRLYLERDRTTKKAGEQLLKDWEGWRKGEETYVERDRPQEHADIIVDGNQPFERAVDAILEKVRRSRST